MSTKNQTVTISKAEYDLLLRDRELLAALESGGVDNWEGYHWSTKEFYAKEFGDEV